MTVLPKRNPFLLAVYFLAVIMMFVFIAWVILYPYGSSGYTGAAVSQHMQDTGRQESTRQETTKAAVSQTAQPSRSVNTNTVADQVPEQRQPLRLAGTGIQLNLQRPLQTQIDRAWQRFIDTDLLSKVEITNSTQVYAVYHGYNQQAQTVRMTIGYVVNERGYVPTGIDVLEVAGGRYLRLSGENVLDNWSNSQRFGDALTYTADYELYLLNENYQVLSQVAFLAVK
ncbi:effector binding domain-containing protein [Aliamphritea spongicola]|uniref:effector binding domain-containing protein n=1 Tax=Aliamphritea spongicola TaxID=707589 RepID=UPI00196B366E|nr:effector binding domain-containing protein [Aliamphritea spongicola]MBN3561963.1 effector binding domain-containing protein [Aliamphritea spongicola]